MKIDKNNAKSLYVENIFTQVKILLEVFLSKIYENCTLLFVKNGDKQSKINQK